MGSVAERRESEIEGEEAKVDLWLRRGHFSEPILQRITARGVAFERVWNSTLALVGS